MEEEESANSPRSRREQIQEVVDNYKEKLRQIKGQVNDYKKCKIVIFSIYPLTGFSHDGQPEPTVSTPDWN